REALKWVGIEGGIEITSISDIPSEGTGLGSSSTYTVGLLKALYAFVGQHVGAERLAREACHIEIECCGKPIGKQDQYIAAYGGLQYIQFNADESVFVDPIIGPAQLRRTLESRLLMFYIGGARSANDILREQRANSAELAQRARLHRMACQAETLRDALERGALDCMGTLLHDGWTEKKQLASSISNAQIDEWYDVALQHGAQGGKVLGAGGGGFLLLYALPECHEPIKRALPKLRHIPFRFEPQGSKIIYVETNE
ncbi:MAG: GHMP kinase, partial [Chloroflexi bacterium]|nr:GHMP kinase [Chloroflexota bacterium]